MFSVKNLRKCIRLMSKSTLQQRDMTVFFTFAGEMHLFSIQVWRSRSLTINILHY